MYTEQIIQFEGLTKFYGSQIGIKDLNFSIDRSEIFGFLGPNGAGKTTTIRLMLDLLKPSAGQVRIFGKEIHQDSFHIRKRLGYLPGDFSPYDKMTGREFLRFSARLRGYRELDPKPLLNRFELAQNDLNKKIRAYSQGMKQKLGIIHAVIHEPELIILDEPSSGLDPLMQEALYDLILDLNVRGSTIFFSSHNLAEVEKICQKVAIVKAGKLVGHESLETLRRKISRKMIITLQTPVEIPPEFPGASLLSGQQNTFEYLITGDFNELLQVLATIPLKDLWLPEPSLEDIFLSYYEKKKL